MKIFITGATGYVGSHLIKCEVLKECSLTLIARNGINSELPKNSKLIRSNIYKDQDLFSKEVPDILIHLAWGGLPNYHSLHHFEEELPNQFSFLKRAVEKGVKRILVTGTCFEYGDRYGCLIEDLHTSPTNSYGFAKDSLRKQLEFLKSKQEFDLVWTRLFYSFGDGQSINSLYSQFKKTVQENLDEFPMSGGEQLRDYLPIENQVEIIAKLALDKNAQGIFNVCSGKPISVLKLVQDWAKHLNSDITLKTGEFPYPDYEPFAFWGCNKKLIKQIGHN